MEPLETQPLLPLSLGRYPRKDSVKSDNIEMVDINSPNSERQLSKFQTESVLFWGGVGGNMIPTLFLEAVNCTVQNHKT